MSQEFSILMTSFSIDNLKFSGRTIVGNINNDPENYYEEFDLLGIGIYNFLAVNINGVSYSFTSPRVRYNFSTGRLRVKGIKLRPTDKITVLFNKIDEIGLEVKVQSLSIMATEESDDFIGDFDEDPMGYTEYHFLPSDMRIHSLIGMTINGIFHCHTDVIRYDPIDGKIVLNTIKIRPNYDLVLLYNEFK